MGDAVDDFMRPDWITHETKAANPKFDLAAHDDPGLSDDEIVQKLMGGRPRVGGGELIREGAKTGHVCEVLDLYRSPKLDVGAVWRCDCGKRWTYVKNAANVRSWQRRFWPWPR